MINLHDQLFAVLYSARRARFSQPIASPNDLTDRAACVSASVAIAKFDQGRRSIQLCHENANEVFSFNQHSYPAPLTGSLTHLLIILAIYSYTLFFGNAQHDRPLTWEANS